MTPDEMTYEQAVKELETILRTIQGDHCDIDQLAQLTRRASQLLNTCRSKLTATEDELKQILTELEVK